VVSGNEVISSHRNPKSVSENTKCPQCGKNTTAGTCLRCALSAGLEAADAKPVGPGFLDDLPLAGSELLIADKYRVLQTIGRGGMGVVYKACQENLDRAVAVKMVSSGAHASQQEKERFLREAKIAARLQHPGIVAVHDWGEDQGVPFFSMEFINGRDLAAEVTASGPVEPNQAARWVRSVAEAVAFAHGKGVLHRDLKPQNLLLTSEGRIKITDFGLAKAMNLDASLTATGLPLGTWGYMAPEQAAGKADSVSVDIYGLGAVLYHLLTGRAPFVGNTLGDVLEQIKLEEPVPLRRLNRNVPADLETICLKCLQKEPDRRYASTQVLVEELGRFLERKPILAKRTSRLERARKWAKRQPLVAGLSGILATLVFLGAGLLYWQWDASAVLRETAESQRQKMDVLGKELNRARVKQIAENSTNSGIPPASDDSESRPSASPKPIVKDPKTASPSSTAASNAFETQVQKLVNGPSTNTKAQAQFSPVESDVTVTAQANDPKQAGSLLNPPAEMPIQTIFVAPLDGDGSQIPGWHPALGAGLAEMLITELAKLNKFQVLESTASQNLKEIMKLSDEGHVPMDQYLEKGAFAGADFMFRGKVTRFGTTGQGIHPGGITPGSEVALGIKRATCDVRIDWRIVDVYNRKVIAAGQTVGEEVGAGFVFSDAINGQSSDLGFANQEFMISALGKATVKAINAIMAQVNGISFPQSGRRQAKANTAAREAITAASEKASIVGKVTAVPGQGIVIVSVGSQQGLKVGDKLQLFEPVEIKNEKGEVVWSEEKPAGEIILVEVQAERSKASHAGAGEVMAGWSVRP
jgi:serine/threonine protein kinase